MSAKLYDDAIMLKIKQWCNDLPLTITDPGETVNLFHIMSDKQNDKPIILPLICITKNQPYQILNVNKKPLTFDGFTLDATIKKSIQLNAIPIKIDYQLDVITRYMDEADELMRNFVFNFINYPTVKLTVPYNDCNVEVESNITINSAINNNSNAPLKIIPGQFTRLTLDFTVDDAYLWDAKYRPNYKIKVDVIEK